MGGFNPMGAVTDFITGQDTGANDLAPPPNQYNVFGLDFANSQKLIDKRNEFDPTAAFANERKTFSDSLSAANQARAQQQGFVDQLAAQANGTAPSLSELQLRQAMDQNIQQQAALAASQPNASSGLALRRVLDSTAAANQQLAQSATQQRLVERLAAQQLYGNTLNSLRGGDLQTSQLAGNFGLGIGGLAAQNQAGKDAFVGNLYGLANQRDLGLGGQDMQLFGIKSGNINAINQNRERYKEAELNFASNVAKGGGGG